MMARTWQDKKEKICPIKHKKLHQEERRPGGKNGEIPRHELREFLCGWVFFLLTKARVKCTF